MAIEFTYRLTSATHSQTGDDNDTSGTWLMFAAIVLLAVVLVLFVAGASSINPGDLWPEPSLIGP
jgi:LPXTG-motif cell wall-anchored protein